MFHRESDCFKKKAGQTQRTQRKNWRPQNRDQGDRPAPQRGYFATQGASTRQGSTQGASTRQDTGNQGAPTFTGNQGATFTRGSGATFTQRNNRSDQPAAFVAAASGQATTSDQDRVIIPGWTFALFVLLIASLLAFGGTSASLTGTVFGMFECFVGFSTLWSRVPSLPALSFPSLPTISIPSPRLPSMPSTRSGTAVWRTLAFAFTVLLAFCVFMAAGATFEEVGPLGHDVYVAGEHDDGLILDSGCTIDICSDPEQVSNIRPSRMRIRVADDRQVNVDGEGVMDLSVGAGILHRPHVAVVPGFRKNLLSIRALDRDGYKTLFDNGRAFVYRKRDNRFC